MSFPANADLTCASRELGEEIPDDELKAMLDEFDLDGDGESKSSAK